MNRTTGLAAALAAMSIVACGGTPSPGVVHGEGRLARISLIDLPSFAQLQSVSFGHFRPDSPEELCVVFAGTATFFTLDGAKRDGVSIGTRVARVGPIEVDGDGECEFLNRGGGWSEVSLLRHDGSVRWAFKEGPDGVPPNDLAVADLDGDGALEYLVATRHGLRCLDEESRVKWQQQTSGITYTVVAVDVDSDSRPELVTATSGNFDDVGVWICDGNGNRLRRVASEKNASVTPVRWPEVPGNVAFVVFVDSESYDVVSVDGAKLRTLQFPVNGHISCQAEIVRFVRDSHPYLVIGRTLSATGDRSAFAVYDPGGELIYAEVLPGSPISVVAVPDGSSGDEALAVGAGDRVWKYTLARN